MTIPNPDHLFEQTEQLAAPHSAGAPRQVDLRRAVSAAYYGLFHFCLAAVADEFVGATHRTTSRYTPVYRSISHKSLKDLCSETRKQSPQQKYRTYIPPGGFDAGIVAFSTAAIDLQERRHLADYDPQSRFNTSDARLAVSSARSAVGKFQAAKEEHRRAFLTLLICPLR